MRVAIRGPVFLIGALLLLLSSCASSVEFQRLQRENKNLQDSIDELKLYLSGREQAVRNLREENAKLRQLATSREALDAQKERLEKLMAEFSSRKTTGGIPEREGMRVISNRVFGEGIQIDNLLLFSSGSAKLTDSGKKTLGSLVTMLQQHAGIHVVGHTDTDPIRHSDWSSNLDLSAGRAISVAEQLHRAGIPYDKIRVTGVGSSMPASEATPRDKSKDRRVEIYLLD